MALLRLEGNWSRELPAKRAPFQLAFADLRAQPQPTPAPGGAPPPRRLAATAAASRADSPIDSQLESMCTSALACLGAKALI